MKPSPLDYSRCPVTVLAPARFPSSLSSFKGVGTTASTINHPPFSLQSSVIHLASSFSHPPPFGLDDGGAFSCTMILEKKVRFAFLFVLAHSSILWYSDWTGLKRVQEKGPAK